MSIFAKEGQLLSRLEDGVTYDRHFDYCPLPGARGANETKSILRALMVEDAHSKTCDNGHRLGRDHGYLDILFYTAAQRHTA